MAKIKVEDTPELDAENKERIERFSKHAKDYYTANGKHAPNPCIMDKEGKVHWVNRAQRRAQMKKKK